MFHLIFKRRVVTYPSFAAPPELVGEGVEASLTIVAFTLTGEGEFVAFDESCMMRRAEFDGSCLRKPDEEFIAIRRAPECPTSRYCFDDCVD